MTICEQLNRLIAHQANDEPITEIHLTHDDYEKLRQECLLHMEDTEIEFTIQNTMDNPMGYTMRYHGVPVYVDGHGTKTAYNDTALPYEMIQEPLYDVHGIFMRPTDFDKNKFLRKCSFQWTIDNPYIEADEINISEDELNNILNI